MTPWLERVQPTAERVEHRGKNRRDRYKATTALPSAALHQATSELRVQLRRLVTDGNESRVPDWTTLRVVGPVEVFDPRGGICFEYRGSVECRSLGELPRHPAAAEASRPAALSA